MKASRRIYQFDFIYNWLIGNSVEKAKYLALSLVGNGFKTIVIMIALTFWSVTCMIFYGLFNYVYGFFAGLI